MIDQVRFRRFGGPGGRSTAALVSIAIGLALLLPSPGHAGGEPSGEPGKVESPDGEKPVFAVREVYCPGHFGNSYEVLGDVEMREVLGEAVGWGFNRYGDWFDMDDCKDPFWAVQEKLHRGLWGLAPQRHIFGRRYTPLPWYASWAKHMSARATAIGKHQ